MSLKLRNRYNYNLIIMKIIIPSKEQLETEKNILRSTRNYEFTYIEIKDHRNSETIKTVK